MPESRFSVGNVEIIGITDIEVDFPMALTQVFPQVPLEAWREYQQRYPDVFPRPDTWRYLAPPLRRFFDSLPRAYDPRGYGDGERGDQSRRGRDVHGGTERTFDGRVTKCWGAT